LVIWSEPAKSDLKQIFDYISEDSKYYAHEVIDKLVEATEILNNFPRLGRIVPEKNDESIREIFKYSYRIIYQITESIEILTIVHSKQDYNP
jgi:addiction module RelE/StbE family toxin